MTRNRSQIQTDTLPNPQLTTDPIGQITGKLGQLHALLTCLHADGLENFNTLSAEIQDNLLWLAAELTLSISDTIALLPYPTPATRS
ncbi:hypothetical protein G9Q38_10570 [Pusillimonas sp. DMV24BSW_D]|uniref:hypothetical protein n=1 Tax=Neopusillimonas aestuarii TaxID=2716226 RepID=UPI00140E53A6|nr:hypothetical protein [Pusillimonas sp. DMV24BSW_D]QIM49587.1 hypothetical protein G9Q38_10570 [Pusillimonas sp. DMV24BSW_D]